MLNVIIIAALIAPFAVQTLHNESMWQKHGISVESKQAHMVVQCRLREPCNGAQTISRTLLKRRLLMQVFSKLVFKLYS
jgi:hypothetical protein